MHQNIKQALALSSQKSKIALGSLLNVTAWENDGVDDWLLVTIFSPEAFCRDPIQLACARKERVSHTLRGRAVTHCFHASFSRALLYPARFRAERVPRNANCFHGRGLSSIHADLKREDPYYGSSSVSQISRTFFASTIEH